MIFLKKYRNWTIEDWKQVVQSDKTKINRFGFDRTKWTWKSKNEMLKSHIVNSILKFGGGSVMIWGV